MSNEFYGHLTVISVKGRYRTCRCECGTIKAIRIDHLRNGETISCGCVGKRNSALAKITHGMSNTRVFKIWMGMLDRCKNDHSGHYGLRGITVCSEWAKSFNAFYRDMGDPPSRKHSIDRIDVNGHYEPDNCRWATSTQQARNTRRNTMITFRGETKTLVEWSEITGISSTTLCVRLYKLGWDEERALSSPVRSKRIKETDATELSTQRPKDTAIAGR